MVYACDEPRQTQTKKDVDRVTSCDISDGVIGMFFIHGGSSTGEKVWKGCSQRHKGYCCIKSPSTKEYRNTILYSIIFEYTLYDVVTRQMADKLTCDGIVKTHKASKNTGQITNNRSQ